MQRHLKASAFGLRLGCIRGRESVFSGVNLELSSGGAWLWSVRTDRQILAVAAESPACAAFRGSKIDLHAGSRAHDRQQTHYLGHLDALKPALDGGREPWLLGRLSGRPGEPR